MESELRAYCEKLMQAELDAAGHELNNPNPINANIDIVKPLTLQERITRILNTGISLNAQAAGKETFLEANDFDVDEEDEIPEPLTKYQQLVDEIPAMTEEPPPEESDTSPPSPEEESPVQTEEDAQ